MQIGFQIGAYPTEPANFVPSPSKVHAKGNAEALRAVQKYDADTLERAWGEADGYSTYEQSEDGNTDSHLL